jgi:hypothetical protein
MTLVQRKFAAGLITLFVVSSTSYTGQTTKRTLDDCNPSGNLEVKIRECLEEKGINFEKLCITDKSIDVFLNSGRGTPVACYVIDGIRRCAGTAADAVDPQKEYNLTISITSPTPGAKAQIVYRGHTGIGSDPDTVPDPVRICTDTVASAARGIVRFDFELVEKKVSKDAMERGVRIDNLRVRLGKCKDKPCLQVSGKASAPKLSESQVRGIVAFLVNEHTGALNINTDNLKPPPTYNHRLPPRSGKDIRIK